MMHSILVKIVLIILILQCKSQVPCSPFDTSCNLLGYILPDLIKPKPVSPTVPVPTPANFTFSYTTKVPILDQGYPISTLTPTVIGTITNAIFTVTPALPSGLSISNLGVITGTPTVSSESTIYTVSGTDSVGTSKANFTTAVISNAGLLMLYKFDGNISDATANPANVLTPSGASLFTTDRFSRINFAVQSIPANRFSKNDSNLPSGNSPRTACGWVYFNSLPSIGTDRCVITYYATGTGTTFAFSMWGINPPRIILESGNAVYADEGNKNYQAATWIHTCAILNPQNTFIYTNGVLTAMDASWSVTLLNTPTAFQIGASVSGAASCNYSLDDIRFYNRQLTPAEIKALSDQ